ncbi:hypothetical protein N0V88_006011 [Collariella sp. IMI 366227]|nr:hypothetical protein N0V88_006011 [Collariella sp. IMI 366227]
MDSKFFASSPIVASTKRGLDQELRDSPTVKRAKRARHGKKRRSKGEQIKEPEQNNYVEQKDWVPFDSSPPSGSFTARKVRFLNSPTPFPVKLAQQAHKSARKEQEAQSGNKITAATAEKKTLGTEANTWKTRADHKGHKHAKKNGVSNETPTNSGSSKPSNRAAAELARELTPISDFTSAMDFTFKAFPNPPVVPPTSLSPASTPANNTTITTANPPIHPLYDSNNNTASSPTTTNSPADNENNNELESALKTTSGTNTLRAINKHLATLSSSLTTRISFPAAFTIELTTLRSDISAIHARLERDEMRAAVRHTVLFNALVKVAADVGRVGHDVEELKAWFGTFERGGEDSGGGGGRGGDEKVVDGEGQATMSAAGGEGTQVPGSAPKAVVKKEKGLSEARERQQRMSASMLQSRKTLEQCFRIYMEDMDRAVTKEEAAGLTN